MIRKFSIFLFPALFLLQSCDPLMIYDSYQETNQGIWHHSDIKSFEVEVIDSLTTYNLLVNIRHTTDYPYNNLFVFITTEGSSGNSIKDTLEISITDKRGKWLGYGFGKIKHISRMYKKNVRFSCPGKYVFIIEQAMRQQEVPVTDVGLRIEKFKDLR